MPTLALPLLQPLKQRQAGVLLHISSLANGHAIGNFGAGAHRFMDFLEAAGLSVWQVCPLGPTGYGDSPYQSFSSFALNPYYIDLEALVQLSYLEAEDLLPYRSQDPSWVDYGQVYTLFWPLAKKAYAAYRTKPRPYPGFQSFESFCKAEHSWLDPYARFMALKDRNGGKSLSTWHAAHPYAEARLDKVLEAESQFYEFLQYLAFAQWAQLRAYAKAKHITLIGDLPIFVAEDSADVWAQPELFMLDKDWQPSLQAGVPPDYFSPAGQLWGNPLYNWEALKQTQYQFWIQRLAMGQRLFDCLRLDHFRGFEAFWAVPAGSPNATSGSWQAGPGLDLFQALAQHFQGKLSLIAENLGLITEPVEDLLAATGLPGMAVLQFGFGSVKDDANRLHNLSQNQVVYTGTHDNDTAWGWYRTAPPGTQKDLRDYLRVDGSAVPWDLIRAAYASVCQLAIFPLQDALSLGSEARFNTPAQPYGNWSWRYTDSQLHALWKESAGYLHYLGSLYGRL